MSKLTLPFIFLLLILPASTLQNLWGKQNSTYTLDKRIVDGGGTDASSDNYVLRGSAGQPTIGMVSNPSYTAYIGYWAATVSLVGVEEETAETPMKALVFSLSQNYPNPFISMTSLHWSVPGSCHTTLKIYNLTGQLVKTLVDEDQRPGYYAVRWNGRHDTGQRVAPGVYFYRLEAGGFEGTKKMILLR